MNPSQKAKTARILGYICVVAGVLNLLLAGILALGGRTRVGIPLLAAGFGALTVGSIILTRGKQEPESGD